MTQDEVNSLINTEYSDKIQLCTLNQTSLDYLLFKNVTGGLKQFKGYSAKISDGSTITEDQFRSVTNSVLIENQNWFNS
jgi:hypothetical protein